MCFLALFCTTVVIAQPTPEPVVTESSTPDEDKPLDGVYERSIIKETPPLKYDHIREADVFWEKKIWRVLDVREKMNLPFSYPVRPLISIIVEAVSSGEVTAYMSTGKYGEEFFQPFSKSEVSTIGARMDTVEIVDPVTFKTDTVVRPSKFNPADVVRYRIKEIWFFDEETSTMQVRILGISPLRNVYDDFGDFKYEQPMFWVYYPELRNILAREPAFNPQNDATRMSWEDIFEMRYFASYIIKESNVLDARIQDSYSNGLDALMEAEKIKNQIFSFEHDLWSY